MLKYGYSPSYMEISDQFGYNSKCTVRIILDSLTQKGLITTHKGVNRGIGLNGYTFVRDQSVTLHEIAERSAV